MALSELGKTWYDSRVVKSVIDPTEEVVKSRYSSKTNLCLENGDTVIRNLRISDIYIPIDDSDVVYKIEAKEEYRPDLVAYERYGNPLLAWVILSANNMKTVFDFKVGTLIRIPEITNLYSSYGILSR